MALAVTRETVAAGIDFPELGRRIVVLGHEARHEGNVPASV